MNRTLFTGSVYQAPPPTKQEAHERARLALRLKPVIAEKAKEKQVEAGGALRQKSDKAEINTKKELAKLANVSHDTIAKVEKIEKSAQKGGNFG